MITGVEAMAEPTPVCPHCLEPIAELDHFCPACGGPVSSHASIDPLGQVYAAGRAYQNATSSRPAGIVVLGMWLLFGPGFVICLWLLILCLLDMFLPRTAPYVLPDPESEIGFVTIEALQPRVFLDDALAPLSVILTAGFAILQGLLLWKVTARYAAGRRQADPAADPISLPPGPDPPAGV